LNLITLFIESKVLQLIEYKIKLFMKYKVPSTESGTINILVQDMYAYKQQKFID